MSKTAVKKARRVARQRKSAKGGQARDARKQAEHAASDAEMAEYRANKLRWSHCRYHDKPGQMGSSYREEGADQALTFIQGEEGWELTCGFCKETWHHRRVHP